MGERRAARALRAGIDALIAVTVAPRCAACRRVLTAPLDGAVCSSCWLDVRPPSPPLCLLCGDTLPSWRILSQASARCARCRRHPPLVSMARAAGEYIGSLREILHAFKYQQYRSLARPLGRMMAAAGAEVLAGADCIVPVPLHPWRRLTRGFNQAADLAGSLECPVVHALWRVRATATQTGLDARARRRNVHEAFHVSPLLTVQARRAMLHARTIVLIDDVRTTGATLDACAAALMQEGVREVRALTVARATLPAGDGRDAGSGSGFTGGRR